MSEQTCRLHGHLHAHTRSQPVSHTGTPRPAVSDYTSSTQAYTQHSNTQACQVRHAEPQHTGVHDELASHTTNQQLTHTPGRTMSPAHRNRGTTLPNTADTHTSHHIDPCRNSSTISASSVDTQPRLYTQSRDVTPQMSQHTEFWYPPRQGLYGGLRICGFQGLCDWSSPFPSLAHHNSLHQGQPSHLMR